jgi:hypothetical protein
MAAERRGGGDATRRGSRTSTSLPGTSHAQRPPDRSRGAVIDAGRKAGYAAFGGVALLLAGARFTGAGATGIVSPVIRLTIAARQAVEQASRSSAVPERRTANQPAEGERDQ